MSVALLISTPQILQNTQVCTLCFYADGYKSTLTVVMPFSPKASQGKRSVAIVLQGRCSLWCPMVSAEHTCN